MRAQQNTGVAGIKQHRRYDNLAVLLLCIPGWAEVTRGQATHGQDL